ncbi:hypothetical protein PMAYCL1PPCAC_25609, partial [Pristionchus mayeri]
LSDFTVSHILKLADRFQMERMLIRCENHLTQSTRFDEITKLTFADQYRLKSLRDQCLESFVSIADFTQKLKLSPEYDNFSDAMKGAICDRI